DHAGLDGGVYLSRHPCKGGRNNFHPHTSQLPGWPTGLLQCARHNTPIGRGQKLRNSWRIGRADRAAATFAANSASTQTNLLPHAAQHRSQFVVGAPDAPTKFNCALNPKTAQALGVEVPGACVNSAQTKGPGARTWWTQSARSGWAR